MWAANTSMDRRFARIGWFTTGSGSVTICTIYNDNFPDPAYQRLVTTALALFNDAILRVAIAHRLSVTDLRAICTNPEDYANAIEPSSVGGAKIARAIAALATGTNPLASVVRIFAG